VSHIIRCEASPNATLTASDANTYTWSTGETTSVISVSPSVTTTYTVTGTSLAGATSTAMAVVEIVAAPTVNITVDHPTICYGDWSWATYTGDGQLSYSATPAPSGFFDLGDGMHVGCVPQVTTTWTVVGKLSEGCSNTAQAVVQVENITVNSVALCNGTCTDLTASGGTSYTWSTGSTNNPISVCPTTTTSYTVTGITPIGCTLTAVATVYTGVSVENRTICRGGAATLTASGANTYTWSTGSTNNPIVVYPTITTTYTVTGIGGTGTATCISTATVVVTVNPLPTITVNNPTICKGWCVDLILSGGTTYANSCGSGCWTDMSSNTMNVCPTTTTIYSFWGHDINGCANIVNATVTVNGVISANDATICNGDCATLTASGGANYTWNTGATTTAVNVCPTIFTIYTVTGVDGGCTSQANAAVTVAPKPTITINNAAICNGSNATLTASGVGGYTWSTGYIGNPLNIAPSSTTTYYVTGTNGNGCFVTASATVTVNPSPTITVTNASICKGQCAFLTANGANTYTWSNGLGTGNIINTCPVITTTYYVTGTNYIGCTGTASGVVTVSQKPLITGVNNICDTNIITYTVPNQAGTTYMWDVTGWNQSGGYVPNIYTSINYSANNSVATITWNTANLTDCNYARIIVTTVNSCFDKDTLYVFPCCTNDICGEILYLNNTNASTYGSSTISERCIIINGTFDVNTTFTFDNCFITMGPNAKIDIPANNTLTATNTTFFANCCYMWDGIYVGTNAVFTGNYCTVTDAKNAVVSNNGGIYTIANTTFNKNYKSIVVNAYDAGSNLSTVKASTFSCTANLKPMLPPVAGATHSLRAIEVNNVKYLKIGDETNASYLNTFNGNGYNGIDVGIYIKSSGVYIYNNTFTNFNLQSSTPANKGVAIYSVKNNPVNFMTMLKVGGKSDDLALKNTITGCRRGILSYDNTGVQIDNNTIINTTTASRDYGIKVYQTTAAAPGYQSYIINNEIYYLKNGVEISNTKEFVVDSNTIRESYQTTNTGINASACENIVIRENKIIGDIFKFAKGVNLSLCYGSVITCNDIRSFNQGVQFTGTTGAASHLEMNTIQNNNYGFYLNNGIVGEQGLSGAPTDNVWGGNTINDLFTLNCNGFLSSPFWYKGTLPVSGGFLPIQPSLTSGGSRYSCTNGGGGQTLVMSKIQTAPTDGDVILMNIIAADRINFADYDAESKWLAKEGVYKYMVTNKDSLKDKGLKELKAKWDNENFGLLQQVETAIGNNDLATAQSINAGIKASVKPEKGLQDYFAILISCRQNNWTLNKQELNDLTELAKQCPLEYGSAVYKARVLLSLFDDNEYTNKCEATASKSRGADNNDSDNNKEESTKIYSTDNNGEIKVYPNPAKSEMFIEYKLNEGQKASMEFFDIMGNKVLQQSLASNSNIAKVKLDKLSTGLYFYKIIIDNNIVSTDKLSIIK
jgi:hypothetical protein